MSEVLTEKPFDTADPVDTTTVESTTTLTNERGSGEAHLADGTLLEEMKKAVKQSAFAFCFFVIGQANLVRLARSFFFFGCPCQKKLSSILLMPTFLTTSAPFFWVLSLLSMLNERFRYRFMWTLYMKDPEHWIPIQTVASFKRMRQFSSHGLEWVSNAIRLSDFLQVDETGTKVRRTTEPQPPKNQFERSVYAVRVEISFTKINFF